MKVNPVVALLGAVFLAFMVGLFFQSSGESLIPVTEQVSNPAAVRTDASGEKGLQLAVLTLVVLGGIGSIALGLAVALPVLSKQVVKAQQQPNTPVQLLAFRTATSEEGATPQGGGLADAIADNALFIVLGLGGLMVVLALLALVLL